MSGRKARVAMMGVGNCASALVQPTSTGRQRPIPWLASLALLSFALGKAEGRGGIPMRSPMWMSSVELVC
jgi:hypothetical protein